MKIEKLKKIFAPVFFNMKWIISGISIFISLSQRNDNMNNKSILEQDECSPDSMETFNENFIKIVGMALFDFKNHKDTILIEEEGGFSSTWFNDKYALTISADFPYYELYLIADKKEEILKTINKMYSTMSGHK